MGTVDIDVDNEGGDDGGSYISDFSYGRDPNRPTRDPYVPGPADTRLAGLVVRPTRDPRDVTHRPTRPDPKALSLLLRRGH